MGNDDRRKTLFLKLHQEIQQHLGVLIIQGRCRFIKDQQLHVLGERLCDLDQLLLACADILDESACGLMQTHLRHMLFGLCIGLLPVNHAKAITELVAEKHVLADRQERNKGKLLMNNDNIFFFAFPKVVELAKLAVVVDFSAICAHRIDARKHVHQRGFSRAVLADQRMDLPALNDKVYVVQRLDAGEFLGDGFHFQYRIRQSEVPPFWQPTKNGRGRCPARRFVWRTDYSAALR